MKQLPTINISDMQYKLMKYRLIGGDNESFFFKLSSGLIGRKYTMPIEDIYSYEKGIEKMIERQKNVHANQLPMGFLTKNDMIVGCYMKLLKNRINMNKFHLLKKESQVQVLHNLIFQITELVGNNIYPKSLTDNFYRDSDPNILISKKGNVQILKLDGESVEVTDEKSITLDNFVFSQLGNILHFGLDREIEENFESTDKEAVEIKRFLGKSLRSFDAIEMHNIVDKVYQKR